MVGRYLLSGLKASLYAVRSAEPSAPRTVPLAGSAAAPAAEKKVLEKMPRELPCGGRCIQHLRFKVAIGGCSVGQSACLGEQASSGTWMGGGSQGNNSAIKRSKVLASS